MRLSSFELYASENAEGVQTITAQEMTEVLVHSNKSASWFGDPAMKPEELDTMVEEIFAAAGGEVTLAYGDHVHDFAEHPVMRQFVAGAGTVLYGAQ